MEVSRFELINNIPSTLSTRLEVNDDFCNSNDVPGLQELVKMDQREVELINSLVQVSGCNQAMRWIVCRVPADNTARMIIPKGSEILILRANEATLVPARKTDASSPHALSPGMKINFPNQTYVYITPITDFLYLRPP